jgi:hypothetical protein
LHEGEKCAGGGAIQQNIVYCEDSILNPCFICIIQLEHAPPSGGHAKKEKCAGGGAIQRNIDRGKLAERKTKEKKKRSKVRMGRLVTKISQAERVETTAEALITTSDF